VKAQGGFLSKVQADTFALKMANEALNVRVGLATHRKPVQEARKEFLERRTKENTRCLNERRIDEFLAVMTEIENTSQLTRNLIDRYALHLERAGHNPGGQEHHLKIVRAFCKFCLDNKWLSEDLFKNFKMPKSEFEGRPVTPEEAREIIEPEDGTRIVVFKEFDRRRGTFRVRYNGPSGRPIEVASGVKTEAEALEIAVCEQARLHSLGLVRPVKIREGDLWLKEAFTFGHSTMLRISQVWKLTPPDFVAPDQLRVAPIKGQDPVWITLRQEAIEVLTRLSSKLAGQERFFWYWPTVERMRGAVKGKVRRTGVKPTVYVVNGERREVYPRFHDICKVSRISELEKQGFSLGELEQLSNTTQRTLMAHYIKADRARVFAKYKNFRGQPVANGWPPNGGFSGVNRDQGLPKDTTENIENASTSQPIPAYRRAEIDCGVEQPGSSSESPTIA
jgi:hypothetical protein